MTTHNHSTNKQRLKCSIVLVHLFLYPSFSPMVAVWSGPHRRAVDECMLARPSARRRSPTCVQLAAAGEKLAHLQPAARGRARLHISPGRGGGHPSPPTPVANLRPRRLHTKAVPFPSIATASAAVLGSDAQSGDMESSWRRMESARF
jgi:hypothetical protein